MMKFAMYGKTHVPNYLALALWASLMVITCGVTIAAAEQLFANLCWQLQPSVEESVLSRGVFLANTAEQAQN